MSRLARMTVALVIALALPAVALVAAQDEKKTTTETATQKVYVEITQDEKTEKKVVDVVKQVDEKKVDEKKVDRPDEKAKVDAAPAKRNGDVILRKAVKAIEKAVEKRPQAAQVKAVMKVAAPVADADGLDPMAAQFVPQFTPLARTEIHLLLSVCEPTAEQRKKLVASRTKAVKDAAKLYAQSQQRIGRFQNSAVYPQPRALVQEGILAAAKPVLSEEQIGRYQAEVDRRADDQKKLAIRNIVAKMDQDLALSAEQRDKLAASLAKNWNSSWCQSLEMFMYGDQFFPAIPDSVVVPALSPKQATVWKGTQRNGGQIWGGFGIFNGIDLNDDFPADENLEEPKADAPAANFILVAPVEVKVEPKADAKRDEARQQAAKDEAKKEAARKADAAKKDAPKDEPRPAATPKS